MIWPCRPPYAPWYSLFQPQLMLGVHKRETALFFCIRSNAWFVCCSITSYFPKGYFQFSYLCCVIVGIFDMSLRIIHFWGIVTFELWLFYSFYYKLWMTCHYYHCTLLSYEDIRPLMHFVDLTFFTVFPPNAVRTVLYSCNKSTSPELHTRRYNQQRLNRLQSRGPSRQLQTQDKFVVSVGVV